MQQSKMQRSTVYFVFQVATRPGRIFTFEISPDVDQADLLLDIRQTTSLNGRRADTMAVAFDSAGTAASTWLPAMAAESLMGWRRDRTSAISWARSGRWIGIEGCGR